MKVVNADTLLIKRKKSKSGYVLTTPRLTLKANITPEDWVQENGMYKYIFKHIDLTSKSYIQASPSVDKQNIIEIAKCIVVSEQIKDSVVFTAVLRKPTCMLSFNINVLC